MTDREQIERLLALAEIQGADISALFILLRGVARVAYDDDPSAPDISQDFLKLRKKLLQRRLEDLEKTEPARAARFQQLIDESCKIFPFNYD